MNIESLNSAEHIDTLVIGAGLGGIQAGAVHAINGKRTVVIDKASERSYRSSSPSQGSLRGLRTISQPDSLKKAIVDSMSFFKNIQTPEKPILYYPDAPYLMCIKDKSVAQSLTQDLKRFQSKLANSNQRYSLRRRTDLPSPYSEHDTKRAPTEFGISPPENYRIVNVKKSGATRLNIDNLIDHCKNKISQGQGAVLYGHQITDYAKLNNGRYYIEISSRGQKKQYVVNDLVIAAGTQTPDVLNKLSRCHATNSEQHANVDAKELTIPAALSGKNNFAVPQRTLYIKLPADVQAKVIRGGQPKFGALYMLDVDDGVSSSITAGLSKGRLGFYTFFEKINDPDSEGKKVWGMKIGYDPMPYIRGLGSRINQQNNLFRQQEGLMIQFLNKIFDTQNFNASLVVDRSTCEYPLTVAHHPIISKSSRFTHGITLVTGLQGYGAMSVAGAVEKTLQNQRTSPQWTPRRASARTYGSLYTDNIEKAKNFVTRKRQQLNEAFEPSKQARTL